MIPLTRPLHLFAVVAFTVLFFGCATTDTLEKRIRQNSDLFGGLTPEEQNQIRAGIIAVGFSPEMVHMALGKPEKVIPGVGPGEESWIYHNYYSSSGSSLGMPNKVTMNFGSVGANGLNESKIKYYSPEARGLTPTYNVEYDTAAEKIKAESTVKVSVKFTEGTVADIQIINDGR